MVGCLLVCLGLALGPIAWRETHPYTLPYSVLVDAHDRAVAPPSGADSNQKRSVICTFIKNKAVFVPEWLEFHFLNGWDHVVFLDDASSDNLTAVLAVYGSKTTHMPVNWAGNAVERGYTKQMLQIEAYHRCFRRFWVGAERLATIDVDEFLYPCAPNATWREAYAHGRTPHGRARVIEVQCFRYGFNNHTEPHFGPILDGSYAKRALYRSDGRPVPAHVQKACDALPPSMVPFCLSDPAWGGVASAKNVYFPNGKQRPLLPAIHDFVGHADVQRARRRGKGVCCNHYLFTSMRQVVDKYAAWGYAGFVGIAQSLQNPAHPVWEFYHQVEDLEILRYRPVPNASAHSSAYSAA